MLARDAAATTEEVPLSPEQQQLVHKVRRLMFISGFATLLGIAVVIGVIGYRVFRSGGSVAAPEVTTMLPKGARIVSTTTTGERIVVVLEVAGSPEIRTFDAKTLQPAGRMSFATAP